LERWAGLAGKLALERSALGGALVEDEALLCRAARVASLSTLAQREAWRTVVREASPSTSKTSADARVEAELLRSLGEAYGNKVAGAVDAFGEAVPRALAERKSLSVALRKELSELKRRVATDEALLRELEQELEAKRRRRDEQKANVDALVRERLASTLAPWKATVLAFFLKHRLKTYLAPKVRAKQRVALCLQSQRRRHVAQRLVSRVRAERRALEERRAVAALALQSASRGHAGVLLRRRLADTRRQRHAAASTLQSFWASRRYALTLKRAREATRATDDALSLLASDELPAAVHRLQRDVAHCCSSRVRTTTDVKRSHLHQLDDRFAAALKQAADLFARRRDPRLRRGRTADHAIWPFVLDDAGDGKEGRSSSPRAAAGP